MQMLWWIITYVFLFHFFVMNPLEKRFTQKYLGTCIRPSNKCINIQKQLLQSLHLKHLIQSDCLGMPSGHAEISTIIMLFLWLHDVVSLEFAALIIVLFSAQRVLYRRHTNLQVFVGILLGTLYALTYYYIDDLAYIILFTIVIATISLYAISLNGRLCIRDYFICIL